MLPIGDHDLVDLFADMEENALAILPNVVAMKTKIGARSRRDET
jgi:hypothetical protein